MTNDDDLFFHRPTHPPCEQHDGLPCESCNELTELEEQIQGLLKRHRKASVRRNRNHSPLIHRFPLEIVAYIFTLAFPTRNSHPCCVALGSFSPPPKPCNEPSPLILAKVCHTWRVLALSTPALWTDICVDTGEPNLPLLDHHITHSGMAPLSIHLFSKYKQMWAVPGVEQAMSIVVKELHRAASLYFTIKGDLIRLVNTLSDLDLPKAAPLLDELHAHVPGGASVVLRLAIEPPRPRHVVLDGILVSNVGINWTDLASLELQRVRGDEIFREHLASRHLKRLDLRLTSTPTALDHIVNRSIEDLNLSLNCSVNFMLTGSTLPLLRRLYINFDEMHVACALLSDFLRRSACPLQDLTICNWDDLDARGMLALFNVLKTTTTLQRLSLIPFESERTDQFDWFIRQLSSRDRNFLPSLQRFHLRAHFVLPFDLLLDMMESEEHPFEEVLPLQELILERPLASPDDVIRAIPRDDFLRILRLRAAGKTISFICIGTYALSGPVDLVEYWKDAYDIGEL